MSNPEGEKLTPGLPSRHISRRRFMWLMGGAGLATLTGGIAIGQGIKSTADKEAVAKAAEPAIKIPSSPTTVPATIPATVTSTPQLPTETPKPTVKPTERPTNTATATATATKESLDPNPKLIAEGQLPKYVELTSMETLAQKSKETGYEQAVFPFSFSSLEEVSLEKGNGSAGTWWVIDTKKPIDFVSFTEASVISSTQYEKSTADSRKNPLAVVTTDEDLAEMRKRNPRFVRTTRILLPGNGDVRFRELILNPGPDAQIQWNVKPGDNVHPGDSLATIKSGKIAFTVSDQRTNGKIVDSADFNLFIHIGNKLAIPNTNIATGK